MRLGPISTNSVSSFFERCLQCSTYRCGADTLVRAEERARPMYGQKWPCRTDAHLAWKEQQMKVEPGGCPTPYSQAGNPKPIPVAKPAKREYWRTLPHFQPPGKRLFVTFCTKRRWALPESVRRIVLEHCLHDDRAKLWMHGMVVMPDHVHMILTPLSDRTGAVFGLPEILKGIKGVSSRSINARLGRRGSVGKRNHSTMCCGPTRAQPRGWSTSARIRFEEAWRVHPTTTLGCGGSGWKDARMQDGTGAHFDSIRCTDKSVRATLVFR
jgi:REP element-mobilizing transposase RayT